MLAQRCMGWHLTSLGKSHMNSLTDMSNALSCTKREIRRRQTSKCSSETSGWPRVVILHGHDGEITFMVKQLLLMEKSEAPRIFSWAFDKTCKRWKMSHQTPPSMMPSASFAGMEVSKVDGTWSGFADDLFIKVELPDHTAESAKDIILKNRRDAGRGQIQT